MSSSSHVSWSPQVGDRVHVKGSSISGVVAQVVGDGEPRQFILDREGPNAAATLATTSGDDETEERHAFTLAELEPAG